jgi:hypothetical protein
MLSLQIQLPYGWEKLTARRRFAVWKKKEVEGQIRVSAPAPSNNTALNTSAPSYLTLYPIFFFLA